MLRILKLHAVAAIVFLIIFADANAAGAAAKTHVITFGRWTTVPWSPDPETAAANEKPQTLKVRLLLVDGRAKEFTLGAVHDVTDRLFVVRRAFRVNDSLPQDPASHWRWERGGWLLVDRVSGHISPVNLPEFDAAYSAASWYRDYVGYCVISEDGKKLYAVVAQIARRKPVLKRKIEAAVNSSVEVAGENPACPNPTWQRNPARVTFEPTGALKQTFAIRGHTVDLLTEEDDEEASK